MGTKGQQRLPRIGLGLLLVGASACGRIDYDPIPLDGEAPLDGGGSRDAADLSDTDAGCQDECTAHECVGDTFHECGYFDDDPCLDRSEGISCAPADLCLEGACSPVMGCTERGRICDTPPPSTCIDPSTLRAYDVIGECTTGDCSYTSRDIACPNCPSCDPCAGVTCNAPPASICIETHVARTFAGTGTCALGSCTYEPTDTTCGTPSPACADASTMRTYAPGVCSTGECSNVPTDTVCNTPPASICADANTVRTFAGTGTCVAGSCTYEPTDTPCLLGCQAGRCDTGLDAYIKASNTGEGDRFGTSISLSSDGTVLAVGAPYEGSAATGIGGNQSDNSASGSGAVYVFRRSGDAWTQEAYIKASNTGAGDWFGHSVTLSSDGTVLAVGAPYEDSAATGIGGNQSDNSTGQSGVVYVFRRSGGTWAQEAYIKASNTGAGDVFGTSIALSSDGTVLAVGTPNEASAAMGVGGDQNDNSASGSGAVYVFRRSGGTWAQEAYIKASNTGAGDRFGTSVSLSSDGTMLAVGAHNEASAATGVGGDQSDNSASTSGAVYVFRRIGTWAQEAYIKASNTDVFDYFGNSISLSSDGTVLGVSALYEGSAATGIGGNQSDNSASMSGAVYVFRRSGGTWTQEAYIKASNTGAGDRFGASVSLSSDGTVLAVGALWESSAATGIGGNQSDNSASMSGAVYVFRRSGGAWAQEAYIKASNTGAGDRFGASVSLSSDGTVLTVGAHEEDSAATGVGGDQSDNSAINSGTVYVYR